MIKKIQIVPRAKLWRRLIAWLRPVENINVRTYVNNKNTEVIEEPSKARHGDVVIMLETGPNHTRDHILLITNNKDGLIKYVHARAWSREGKYGHGVTRGEIKISHPDGNLLDQVWTELGETGSANETYLEAKNARVLEIRRLKV